MWSRAGFSCLHPKSAYRVCAFLKIQWNVVHITGNLMDFSFVSTSKAKPFSGGHVSELVLALTLIAIGLGLQTQLFALLCLFKQVKQFRKKMVESLVRESICKYLFDFVIIWTKCCLHWSKYVIVPFTRIQTKKGSSVKKYNLSLCLHG